MHASSCIYIQLLLGLQCGTFSGLEARNSLRNKIAAKGNWMILNAAKSVRHWLPMLSRLDSSAWFDSITQHQEVQINSHETTWKWHRQKPLDMATQRSPRWLEEPDNVRQALCAVFIDFIAFSSCENGLWCQIFPSYWKIELPSESQAARIGFTNCQSFQLQFAAQHMSRRFR